jgi:hypothetical protein
VRRYSIRLAVASVFLAGLTLSPLQSAWSEPKPTAAPTVQNDVHIGQPAAAPGAKPGAPGAPGAAAPGMDAPPAKRILKRNPFVPPTAGMGTTPSANPTPQHTAQGGEGTKGSKGGPKATPTPVAIEPPQFTLAGIFSSGGFPTALIMTPYGPVEARVGQTVQGYRVSSINLTSRQVIVQMKNHAFRVSLPKDTPYGKAGAGGGGSAPPAGGGRPLPPPPPAKGGR